MHFVHSNELAAIDGNARRREKAHLTAKLNKVRAYPAKRHAIVLAKVRDRLVIRCEPTQQPHELDIAPGLVPAAGSTEPGSDKRRASLEKDDAQADTTTLSGKADTAEVNERSSTPIVPAPID